MTNTDGTRVAIVDDDPIFAEHISSLLRQHAGMNAVTASNGSQLFKRLDETDVECIVLDYELQGETGLSLGHAIRNKFENPPPIVMLTGAGSERTAAKAFRMGFADYVPKRNLHAEELVWAIKTAITSQREEIAAHSETERLRAQQRVDSLTGLASASFVTARLHELAANHNGEGFSLLAITMRQLDEYRIEFGHQTGEQIFRDFASRISNANLHGGYLGHLDAHKLVCVIEHVCDDMLLKEIERELRIAGTANIDVNGIVTNLAPAFGRAHFMLHGGTVEETISHALDAAQQDEATPQQIDDMPNAGARQPETHRPENDRRSDGAKDHQGEDRRGSQRRVEQRFRVLKRGKITVNGLHSTIDCLVRNISQSGVRIQVDGYFAPPVRFQLEIVGDGRRRWVEKRWQTGNDIGLQYVEEEA